MILTLTTTTLLMSPKLKGDEKEEETLFFALCEPPADTSPILY